MKMNKILLIDDEEDILDALSLSLRSDGHEVITASSGEKGLETFGKELPPIVLTDLKMPGMDGLEVLKKVKAINPDTEVIIITGHGNMDSAIDSLRYGASDFVKKPVREEALQIALKRASEKLVIREKLRAYTMDLENMCHMAIGEVKRKSDFQDKLITSSNDGIVVTDENGIVVIFNPGAEAIFDFPRIDVVRKAYYADLFPAEIADLFGLMFDNGKKMGDVGWKETTIHRKTSDVPVRFSATLLYDGEDIIGSVGFFQDLSEINRLEGELVRSERLAAIGQTVSRLAHYIKNILAGLKGGTYVVNIGLDKKDIDKLRTGWHMVERNVGRISCLVSDLLAYSREREPEYKNCLSNDIVEDVCELLDGMAMENQIEVERDFDSSVKEGSMDPDMVHRTLLNLVSNAVDACIFDLDETKQHKVRVGTRLEDGNLIRFEVADNGCGMSEEVKEKIFSAFFSTKGGKGTGLGLLVVQKLVQEQNGRIDIRSEAGKGSTFIVWLPYGKA
ncbi:MAG: response regulator, partial [Thermodesulfobacteriota bacterium]|nr:response regulator [Thermodesulfobacteriota bacterium]